MKLLLTAGIFSSLGSSSAAAALCLAQGGSILDANTLIPAGVFFVVVGIIARIAYCKGKDDQKMKGVMKRLEQLEKNGRKP